MPNEPEREIEKKLRAYAKERGDAADTTLHPATRRLLLEEAAETYPPGRIARSEPRGWRWYCAWPQLAPAFGVMLLLAMASFFMWPSHRAPMQLAANRDLYSRVSDSGVNSKALVAENRSRNYETVDALKESDAPQQTPAPASVIARGATVTMTLNDNAPAIASARPPSMPAAPAPLAYSPAPVAPPEVQVANLIRHASAPAGATALGTMPGEARQAPTDLAYDLAAAIRTRDFVTLKSATQKAPNAARVLRKFRVEQSGGVLRIIDGDGSVYVGNWLLAAAAEAAKTESMTFGKSADKTLEPRGGVHTFTAAEVTTESGRLAKSEAVDVATIGTTNLSLATDQGAFGGGGSHQFFRVIGTNLSSKQKVIFNGRFETDPTKLNLGLASAEKPASKKAGKADDVKWLTGQISGDASVGSNVFKILAKPADGK